MKTINISQARQNLPGLVKDLVKNHEPIEILGTTGKVVILSQQDWEDIQETLYVYSNECLSEKIKEGLNTPLSECTNLDDLDWWNTK